MYRMKKLFAFLFVLLVAQLSRAGVVTATGTDVEFDPMSVITPVLAPLVAGVGLSCGLFIILWGIKKVYRAIRDGSPDPNDPEDTRNYPPGTFD